MLQTKNKESGSFFKTKCKEKEKRKIGHNVPRNVSSMTTLENSVQFYWIYLLVKGTFE